MLLAETRHAVPPWEEGHFIGGHPALDLTNTLFNRAEPAPDNELLKTGADVAAWCQSVGLVSPVQAAGLAAGGERLAAAVRRVREDSWAVFNAVAEGAALPKKALADLLRSAAAGALEHGLSFEDGVLELSPEGLGKPGAIPTALSLLALEALFVLPKERIRACPRCGWLFVDGSKGGRRRWCSMSTCGNREKARRHRAG
ncbi:CGNR zinc finger domain-containing protein [Chelativorans sp.]|uniref:CGNR zinc finger domain-containing protein n=1 Tax=Chelativorans sp. TaxID=2203393 RepID=UPI00281170A3|nr:CGNR zinc finger domain-containing protein [Chelativorans sp.]